MTKRKFDDNGWYEIENNPISKSGVFQYLGKNISSELVPDQVYNVWRPEEELNNPETINSFKLVPWIPFHEMLGKDFTPAEEVGVQGTTGEQIYFKDGTLLGNIKVYGQKLASLIEEGVKELSLGFRCAWEITSGTAPDGKSYDVIQRKIRGNHLASVPDGRMGSEVAVMDHSVFALDQNDVVKIKSINDGDIMTLEEAQAKIKELEEKIASQAEDMEMAEKKKAEDMEKAEDAEKDADKENAKKEDESKGAMDAAIAAMSESIAALTEEVKVIKSSAVDANDVVKAISDKNALADKASAIIGAFDHSDMDKQAVAKYAIDKIGIACDSGNEIATLDGYFAALKQPAFTVDHGQDSAALAESAALKEMGIL